MSFLDTLWLVLHVGFAILAIGPVTLATSLTPRAIRRRDVAVLAFLHRTTRIYGALALGVFLFGLLLGGGDLGAPYLTVSMTLFMVGAALLVIIHHDQSTALKALSDKESGGDAAVQTGRIAALSAIIALLWLIILALMFWFDPS